MDGDKNGLHGDFPQIESPCNMYRGWRESAIQFQETDTYQIHLGNKILQKNEKFKKNIQIILYIHFKQEVATWI